MVELNHIGEIVIDRLAVGAKVTVALYRPGSSRPETVGSPDHFPNVAEARRFAEVAHNALNLPIVDRTGGAA